MEKKETINFGITDYDIATVERLHDMLLDKGVDLYNENLIRSRQLTSRMYASFKENKNGD